MFSCCLFTNITIFRPTVCQIWGGNFNLQDHIAECSGITLKLLFDESLDRLAVPPSNPSKIVEAYISAISDLYGTEDHSLIDSLVQRLVQHICEAIRLTRGLPPILENI